MLKTLLLLTAVPAAVHGAELPRTIQSLLTFTQESGDGFFTVQNSVACGAHWSSYITLH